MFSHDAPYDIERAKGFSLRYAPIRFSHFLREKIYSFIGGDEGGLIAALLTGNTDGISNIFKKALSLSGTSHITAVSGMPCGIHSRFGADAFGKKMGYGSFGSADDHIRIDYGNGGACAQGHNHVGGPAFGIYL